MPAPRRARLDLSRRVGVANAVASGIAMSRAGILSHRELNAIRALAYDDDDNNNNFSKKKTEIDALRQANSRARVSRWPDTLEARHEQFLQRQAEEKEAEEKRRCVLDALADEAREAARLSLLASYALKKKKEDPRGRQAQSAILSDAVLKEWGRQVDYHQARALEDATNEEELQQEMLQKQREYQEEERKRQMERRGRNVQEKSDNLEMVLFQINERRDQRREKKHDRLQAERDAHEQQEEELEEIRERAQKQLEMMEYNHQMAKPYQNKRDRLRSRVENEKNDAAIQQAQEEKIEALKAVVLDAQRKKQALFEKRKELGFDAYIKEQDKVQTIPKTQDRFEQKGTYFLNKMFEEDVARVQKSKEDRKAAFADVDPEKTNRYLTLGKPRAAATASGFLSHEEEKECAERLRREPQEIQKEILREAALRREEALQLQHILKLQAEEKHEHERRLVEAEKEELRRQIAEMEEDDAKYREFLEAQLPQDMNPTLRKLALAS